jgi:murein DD-endopeptidase MepM/ murein hydrolase activator NlpD
MPASVTSRRWLTLPTRSVPRRDHPVTCCTVGRALVHHPLGVHSVLHAKPGLGLRARALPVLLVSACAAAFGGLVALAPADGSAPSVLAYTDRAVTPLQLEEPAQEERALARASRSRRLQELAQAEAEARARAEAEARARAEAEAAAQAKAAAEAAAKAQAEEAAKAKAKAAAEAAAKKAAAQRSSGRCPVPNASFTDTWGAPRSGGRTHQGTDLMAPHGSPVYAVASGRVRTASSSAGGISLYLDADNGETYFYAHNQSNAVRSGQRVQAGQLVARVGSSGNAPSDAPHVHFERHVGGRSINPYDFLRRLC